VDPIFRKNGQTVIPLKIGGTRNAPAFGMDVKRVLRPAR
jgi:predicted nuclease with RNAse H fold